MVKKSNKLPKPDSAAVEMETHQTLPTSGTPRGRGRPPKPKSDSYIQPVVQPGVQPIPSTVPPVIAQPGGQPFQQPAVQPNTQANSQPGLEPNSAVSKKRPGRPRKITAVGGVAKRGRGRPPGSKANLVGTRLSKKSPRKPKSVLGPLGSKRGPGRPSKAEPMTVIIPNASVVDQNSILGVIPMSPKRRGRPKKGASPSAQPSATASDALIASNGELKRKFDFFQSKLKQAVGMLKPELTHESSVTAIAAVQELEELAMMDLNAPLREEAQHSMVQT